jgi:drug/metabolite transporter (DMT)-like permease
MTSLPSSTKTRYATWVTLVFIYVYMAWGVTYMALHFALETMPPYLISGSRFFVAGLVLLAVVRIFQRAEFHAGSLAEWRDAAIVGTILFLGGNASVAWAQQYVNTSTTALIFGSIPLFIILIDWLRPGGVRPSLRAGLGLALGFAGLCVLIKPAAMVPDTRMEIWGKCALVFAAVAWAVGAIYSRQVHAKGSPLLPMARQMISGGAVLLVVSYFHGEWARVSPGQITVASWLGWGYLVTFGSLLGYTAYAWLLRVSTPERVSTVTYVNTVVATILGWLAGEPLSPRIVLGAAIIIGSVVIVLRRKSVRDVVDATPSEA